MKLTTTILIFLLCLCFSTVAQTLTPDIEGMYSDKVYSPSLEGNLLGDPAERNLIIYLPPSYQTSTKRYPVVYMLHGYGDSERQYISQTDPVWQTYKEMGLGDPPDFPKNGFGPMMDELIAQGKIDEMIIVTPNASNAYGGSWYNNSVLIGNYEDYITKDLVNYIDSKYRTIPDRNSRAIAGQSMGGYGAIKLAMRYPDVFGSVASSAGVLYLDLFKATIPAIIAENPDGMTGPSPDKMFTSATYSMSAAFAPNLNKPPFYVDLSFEYPSPEVIQSVWDKYLKNDPVTMAPTHVDNLASLNFIYIDAGDIDEYGANYQTQAYHEALKAVGINHVYRTFAGGHRNKLFESLKISLSYFSDVFEQSSNIATRKLAYTDLWNKGNLGIVDQIYSNDFAGSMAGYSGKDEVKMSVTATLKAYPDIQFTIDDIFASGDLVVTRITAVGTQTGVFMGVPPTNSKGEITGISIARFENGLIKEVWENNDELATAEHLGVIPQMRTAYVWGEPSQVKGTPGTPEANKAIVLNDIEKFWNQQKVNEMDDTYSPDFLSHNPNTPVCPTSFDIYKKVALAYISAFPDLHITVKDVIASGDKVAVRWASTGTQKGKLMSIPATWRKASWTGITIYRIVDGKIAEQWWAYDMLGMIQQLTAKPPKGYDNVFFTSLSPGLNMISLPLKPIESYTARSFAEYTSSTVVIRYNETLGKFEGFSMNTPGDGFTIEGGKGYIVNVPSGGTVAFTGSAWTNEPSVQMAPPAQADSAWAFIVNGSVLDGDMLSVSDSNYTVTVRNLNTGTVVSESVGADGYFANAYADLNRKAVVRSGDKIEVAVTDNSGELVSGPFVHTITMNEIGNAVMNIPLRLGNIMPKDTALLQNFPNPFNPETWIPFQLKNASDITITIFNADGRLVRKLELGRKDPGVYASQINAAHWDGKNDLGETVSSGIYFYNIKAGDFSATKKMIVKK